MAFGCSCRCVEVRQREYHGWFVKPCTLEYAVFNKASTSVSSLCFIFGSIGCFQVGILPTDTYPALVCDISDKSAVEKLYAIKGLSPKKQLSILCRHLQDISTYTLGFPASNVPGQINLFRVARQVLPGPVNLLSLACVTCSSCITGSLAVKWKYHSCKGQQLPHAPVMPCVCDAQWIADLPIVCMLCSTHSS